jgi:hypothetical protein
MKRFNIQNLFFSIRCVVLIFTITTLMACASGIVFHTFEFNAFADSPDIQVLDYRYGDAKTPMARATEFQKINGGVLQRSSIGGDMLVGDSLYVKWKIKATDKFFEDTVDLKKLLPRNIENHRIYFIVKDKQLFVYLITPNRRLPTEEPNGPKASNYLKTITLSSNFGREVASQ